LISPNVIKASLQEYMLNLQISDKINHNENHEGVNIILKVMQNYNTNDNNQNKQTFGLSSIQEFSKISISQIVSLKTYTFGEMNSLLQFKNQINIPEFLIKNFENSVNEYKNGNSKNFIKNMNLSATYIIKNKFLAFNILQWIVWLPFKIFTVESIGKIIIKFIEIGIFCWRWIMLARREFQVQILTEVTNCWKYLILNNIGLFSGKKEFDLIDLSIEEEKIYSNSIPNRSVINFLSEMYQFVRSKGKEIYFNLLILSFKNVDKFAKDWTSFGARFRLCLLGLILSKSLKEKESQILTNLVYDTILNWFGNHPSYYNLKDVENSKELLKEDLNILNEIVRLLFIEQENKVKDKNKVKKDDLIINNKKDNDILNGDNTLISSIYFIFNIR
jgi:hypothetical protein